MSKDIAGYIVDLLKNDEAANRKKRLRDMIDDEDGVVQLTESERLELLYYTLLQCSGGTKVYKHIEEYYVCVYKACMDRGDPDTDYLLYDVGCGINEERDVDHVHIISKDKYLVDAAMDWGFTFIYTSDRLLFYPASISK